MIALYLRLSGLDGDLGKDESNRIENQRRLVMEFLASKKEFREQETLEYVDEGFTGTNFVRPAFARMMEDIRAGKITCVVVKDLSRFGRDYIGVGEYLEQMFPMLGVRFIAINDHYDSDNYEGTTMGIEMVLGNLVNTMYSRDSARKLYSANRLKWEKGLSTTGHIPFGYCKNFQKKGHYALDPEAAQIVRRIFELALEGKNCRQIADILNEEGVPIPSEYNRLHGVAAKGEHPFRNPDKIWDQGKARRILREEVYTGKMIMGRRKRLPGKRTQCLVARSQWLITPGAHEAIVTQEEFEQAQRVIRSAQKTRKSKEEHFPLKGKIRCSHCGCLMRHRLGCREPKVWCRSGRDHARYSGCSKERFELEAIQAEVWKRLRAYLLQFEQMADELEAQRETVKKIRRCVERETHGLEQIRAEKTRLYEQYFGGQLSLCAYQNQKEKIDQQIQEREERIRVLLGQECKTFGKEQEIANQAKEAKRFLKEPQLTEEAVQMFIDCVIVGKGMKIEVQYRSPVS